MAVLRLRRQDNTAITTIAKALKIPKDKIEIIKIFIGNPDDKCIYPLIKKLPIDQKLGNCIYQTIRGSIDHLIELIYYAFELEEDRKTSSLITAIVQLMQGDVSYIPNAIDEISQIVPIMPRESLKVNMSHAHAKQSSTVSLLSILKLMLGVFTSNKK